MNSEELLNRAFNRGFEHEKTYRGCAQCTVDAVQDTLGIQNDSVFKAASGFAQAAVCSAMVSAVDMRAA